MLGTLARKDTSPFKPIRRKAGQRGNSAQRKRVVRGRSPEEMNSLVEQRPRLGLTLELLTASYFPNLTPFTAPMASAIMGM